MNSCFGSLQGSIGRRSRGEPRADQAPIKTGPSSKMGPSPLVETKALHTSSPRCARGFPEPVEAKPEPESLGCNASTCRGPPSRRSSDTRGQRGPQYSTLGCQRRRSRIPVSFLGFLWVRFGGLASLGVAYRRPKGLHCQPAMCLVNPSGTTPAFRYCLLPGAWSRFELSTTPISRGARRSPELPHPRCAENCVAIHLL